MISRQKVPRVMGYSAGALAAVFTIFPEIQLSDIIRVSAGLVSECCIGFLDQIIKKMCIRLLPPNAYIRANQRGLQIVLCSCADSFRGRVISYWDSTDQLIDCIVASCFIPGLVGLSFTDPIYNCIDGSFAINLKEIYKGYHHSNYTIASKFCEKFQTISEEEATELVYLGENIYDVNGFIY